MMLWPGEQEALTRPPHAGRGQRIAQDVTGCADLLNLSCLPTSPITLGFRELQAR
jgi:hypothetical protein